MKIYMGNGWFGQMQGFMQKTPSPEQHQTLMNSDPAVKAQIGQDNLDRMNQFMSNAGGNMMTNGGSITGSQGNMTNGSGAANKGTKMMGSGSGMASQPSN